MNKNYLFIFFFTLIINTSLIKAEIDNKIPYDVMILLDKFDHFAEIEIIFKNTDVKQIIGEGFESSVVCVVGFPNSGKTFILNLILSKFGRESVPSGYHVSTKGISGIVIKQND